MPQYRLDEIDRSQHPKGQFSLADIDVPKTERGPSVHPHAQFGRNVISSAQRLGSGLVDAASNPGRTVKGVVNTLGQVGNKINSAIGLEEQRPSPELDAATDTLRQRYGSLPAIAKTLYEDPVGAGLDVAGAVSGAGSLVRGIAGAAGRAGAGEVLAASARKNYGNVFNPTTRRMKATAQAVIPEVMDRGVVARSRPALTKQIGENVDRAAAGIDETLQNIPPASRMLPEQQISGAVRRAGNEAFAMDDAAGGRVPKTPDAAGGLAHANELADTLKQHRLVDANTGEYVIPFEKLNEIRQNWDAVVAPKGGYVPGAVDFATAIKTQAYREAAGAIRAELANAHPASAAAKKEFSFWKKVQDIDAETNLRKTGQRTPLTSQIAQTTGAVIGASTGTGPVGKVAGAVAGRQIAKAIQGTLDSTAWQTLSAQTKLKLAKALESGNDGAVAQALQAVAAARIPTPPQTVPPNGPIEEQQ